MSIRQNLPLNAVRVFEAVARLGGVRSAADELGVTPPAVSHQLAKLEDFLGAPLFVRRGRGLELTEAARDYLVEIGPGLEAISRATVSASQRRSREMLTLAAPPSLISTWLIPHLTDFISRYPEYDLRVIDRMTLDPEERGIDIAIEYRFEPDPSFISEIFLKDELVALASPEYVGRNNIRSLEDLRGLNLIETDRRLTSWKSLLSDFSWAAGQCYLYVSYSLHAFEAASRGLGIALGNKANAAHMVNEGRLCVPFELVTSVKSPTPSYFLTTMPHKTHIKKVRIFYDWLSEKANAY
jgi:LysR family glycine cleavage system transcriptional activator